MAPVLAGELAPVLVLVLALVSAEELALVLVLVLALALAGELALVLVLVVGDRVRVGGWGCLVAGWGWE